MLNHIYSYCHFTKKISSLFFNVSIWFNHVEPQENDVFTTPMFDAYKETWDYLGC